MIERSSPSLLYLNCIKSPLHTSQDDWPNSMYYNYKLNKDETIVKACLRTCIEMNKTVTMGVESGINCWCSEQFPSTSTQIDSFCEKCGDDRFYTCGNVNYGFVSVYQINYT